MFILAKSLFTVCSHPHFAVFHTAVLCTESLCLQNLVHGVHTAILNAVSAWSTLCSGLLQDATTSYVDLVAWKHQVRTWTELRILAVKCLKTQLTKFPFLNAIQRFFIGEVSEVLQMVHQITARRLLRARFEPAIVGPHQFIKRSRNK